MRVGLRTRTLSADRLAFCKQIGVDDIFLDHREPRGDVFTDAGEDFDESATVTIDRGVVPTVDELEDARERAADAGLRLAGIQSLSYNVYGDVMLGTEGRDEQLETIQELLRNLGEAGLPILGYQWNPRGVVPMRTSERRVRGGARGRAFDVDEIVFVHFRDVVGTWPSFEETFIDDTDWGHRGRAHAVGYLKGLLDCTLAHE